jgi:hypothetical protein
MATQIRSVDLADAAAVRGIYAPCVLDSATSFETAVARTAGRSISCSIDPESWSSRLVLDDVSR